MTEIWAHRGASAHAPENTLPAFELAAEMGAEGIELDLQRTLDGRLVVCHDETVDRTSDGTGAIVAMPLDAVRALDFSAGGPGFSDVRIPLLEEVFELVRPTGMSVNVELKDSEERYPGMYAQACELAAQFGMTDRVIWSSFNHWSLRDIRAADRGARLGVLYGEPLLDPWDYARGLGAQAVHPYFGTLAMTPGLVERCHQAGVAVNVWTVNQTSDARAMAAAGVDAIITNHPELRVALG